MVTIIRGLPGSGKSTYARNNFPGILIVEADMFAMIDGQYRFSIDRLSDCHWAAQQIAGLAIQLGADVVITGTMTTRKEIAPYVNLANNLEQDYQILHCTGAHGTIHDVPESTIEKMRARWEPWDDEKIVE